MFDSHSLFEHGGHEDGHHGEKHDSHNHHHEDEELGIKKLGSINSRAGRPEAVGIQDETLI